MSSSTIRRLLVACAAIALTASACGSSSKKTASPPTTAAGAASLVEVTLGHIADLTGPAKSSNEAQLRGVGIATQDLATEGKVKIDLNRIDSGGDTTRATAALRQLADDSKVLATFGPANSGEFFAASPLAAQVKLPIVSISSGGTPPAPFNPYTFRTSFPDNRAIPFGVDYAKSTLNASKVATLYANDNDFARTSGEFFDKTVKDKGLNLVDHETFSAKDIDFSAQAQKIAAAKPDVVMFSANVNAGLLIKAIRAVLPNTPMVTTASTLNTPSTAFEAAGGNTSKVFVVSAFNPADTRPVVQNFIKEYQAANAGQMPGTQEALGYDALRFMGAAVASVKGPVTRDSLLAAMGKASFEGVTGTISFPDGSGDASRNGASILTVVAPGVFGPAA
jgi:branched-chain amino acid transport system substrate-binding protein